MSKGPPVYEQLGFWAGLLGPTIAAWAVFGGEAARGRMAPYVGFYHTVVAVATAAVVLWVILFTVMLITREWLACALGASIGVPLALAFWFGASAIRDYAAEQCAERVPTEQPFVRKPSSLALLCGLSHRAMSDQGVR